MNLELTRTKHGLIPTDDASVNAVKKIQLGNSIIVDYKPKRNLGHHKKLFSMLRAVLPNQVHYKSENNLLTAIKFRGGFYEVLLDHRGEKLMVPDSIAFDAMSQEDFEQFYDTANMICCELVGDDALEDILRYI